MCTKCVCIAHMIYDAYDTLILHLLRLLNWLVIKTLVSARGILGKIIHLRVYGI